MKKTILTIAVASAMIIGMGACTSTDSLEEIQFEDEGKSLYFTDPDEPQPGCDNPNGCG